MQEYDKKLHLNLKEIQLIESYPFYFQEILKQAALNGESIEDIAGTLEKDWDGLI
ncbi:hypothetical protein [Nonlabens xiamenensis]|uniref:hypothetical protein n=1 Tax=Nonlabens xiamenensis TaxID=2341043 RepID=UPI0013DE4420|nr:hypothetical protein [Nonlabens xiamenensis]